jgi:hypothetical protein
MVKSDEISPLREPAGHCGARRQLRVETFGREFVAGFAQRLEDALAFGIGCGVDHEPAMVRVHPGGGCQSPRQRARQKLVEHALLDLAHLLAADAMPLFLRQLGRALDRDLPDNRGGQELLLDSQCQ